MKTMPYIWGHWNLGTYRDGMVGLGDDGTWGRAKAVGGKKYGVARRPTTMGTI